MNAYMYVRFYFIDSGYDQSQHYSIWQKIAFGDKISFSSLMLALKFWPLQYRQILAADAAANNIHTNISHVISNHVFIMIYSGKRNPCLITDCWYHKSFL